MDNNTKEVLNLVVSAFCMFGWFSIGYWYGRRQSIVINTNQPPQINGNIQNYVDNGARK
jgi:hypothetical protein